MLGKLECWRIEYSVSSKINYNRVADKSYIPKGQHKTIDTSVGCLYGKIVWQQKAGAYQDYISSKSDNK